MEVKHELEDPSQATAPVTGQLRAQLPYVPDEFVNGPSLNCIRWPSITSRTARISSLHISSASIGQPTRKSAGIRRKMSRDTPGRNIAVLCLKPRNGSGPHGPEEIEPPWGLHCVEALRTIGAAREGCVLNPRTRCQLNRTSNLPAWRCYINTTIVRYTSLDCDGRLNFGHIAQGSSCAAAHFWRVSAQPGAGADCPRGVIAIA